ncbi:hypothetical protein DPMN_006899 [Dreissena polymorpha]|uniref:Uncharacterized protein n=1 Tax=Dreissena polymorpha TaxID=45954 RepID=A0A9D4MSA8_DREPO|nr:hypothetical protein DPMN_006899 [Dreissena polymorpha]
MTPVFSTTNDRFITEYNIGRSVCYHGDRASPHALRTSITTRAALDSFNVNIARPTLLLLLPRCSISRE